MSDTKQPALAPRGLWSGPEPKRMVTDAVESLDSLQAEVVARARSSFRWDRWAAHEALLDRLAANVRLARMRLWTSCAIERLDGALHFSAWGLPPGSRQRHPIPDWSTEAASR